MAERETIKLGEEKVEERETREKVKGGMVEKEKGNMGRGKRIEETVRKGKEKRTRVKQRRISMRQNLMTTFPRSSLHVMTAW